VLCVLSVRDEVLREWLDLTIEVTIYVVASRYPASTIEASRKEVQTRNIDAGCLRLFRDPFGLRSRMSITRPTGPSSQEDTFFHLDISWLILDHYIEIVIFGCCAAQRVVA
jgi:hypothetical protein